MGELVFYWHCKAVSEDGKVAYPNHKDDWRCFCDCDYSGLSQGYSMSPTILTPKSEYIVLGDKMRCSRCERTYTIIDREIKCKGTHLMRGCGKMIPYRLIKSELNEHMIFSFCPYCNAMINWKESD